MSIVTKGLGGPSLITLGYGWLKKIIKVIKKIVSRAIPWRRKKFTVKVKVLGDLVRPFRSTVKVTGDYLFPVEKTLIVSGTFVLPVSCLLEVEGEIFRKFGYNIPLTGEVRQRLSLSYPVTGYPVHVFQKEILCEGKKDLSTIVWLLLEDEE
ncbi:hypothetical protein DRN75_03565 [Nanoarchaeota archaeon]|nr:MAG: hypothetical protein DRN75_03565 [Nanoarchaeota archaeon]